MKPSHYAAAMRSNVTGAISSTPIKLPLKYTATAFFPTELTTGHSWQQTYELASGEIVRLEYRSTWNNSDGAFDERLNELCRELYGISFTRVKEVWTMRLKDISNWWHKVRMIRLDANGAEVQDVNGAEVQDGTV
jgi:hypothetical protein